MIELGTVADGRRLLYDAALYEFRVERELCSLEDVRALDSAAHISWRAPEQRDWFRNIDPSALEANNLRALGRRDAYEGMTPEERVQADAKRNDGVIAGKMVDANPVLVNAVADALERQGLLKRAAAGDMPLVGVSLPEGMEALGQLQGVEGRKATLLERLLLRKVLQEDEKARIRREKEAERLEEEAAREDECENDRSARAPRDAAAAGSAVRALDKPTAKSPRAGLKDAQRGLKRQAKQAKREAEQRQAPSGQQAGSTGEEQALYEMRERTKREAAAMGAAATDVPGMERSARSKASARLNGRAVNPDGSPKETPLTKLTGAFRSFAAAAVPPQAAGRGGGVGPGGGGGGAGGGMR